MAMHKRKDIGMPGDRNKGGTVSIEASRKALLRDMRKKCTGKTISKDVPFINDDVPEYLKILANLEERSKKSTIVIK